MVKQEVFSCPRCSAPMRKRTNSMGEFWGCSKFPTCRGARGTDGTPDKASREMLATAAKDGEPQLEWKAKAATRAKSLGYENGNSAPAPKFSPITKLPGSDEQEAIWKELLTGSTHVVVEAVAGSGKTWTMIQACLRIPKTKQIGFIAFNKHIAEEAQGKLMASGCSNVMASTSHSLGLSLIRSRYPKARIDEHKVADMVKRIPNMISFDIRTRDRDWRGVCALAVKLTGFAKNYLLDEDTPQLTKRLEDICAHHAVDTSNAGEYAALAMSMVAGILHDCKATAGVVVDFDDMIWLPVVLNLQGQQFDILFVDEAQDTNICQQALIQLVCSKGRIVVVGDRFQSIYGFRGADVTAIPSMIERLRGTKRGVTICPLTVTRRCPKNAVTLAQAIVPHIQAMDNAPDGVVDSLAVDKAELQMRPGDLVLCRCNAPLIPTAYRLIKAGTKAVIRGRDIGKGLLELVDKLKASDLHDLSSKLNDYRSEETAKLMPLGEKAEARIAALVDKCDCLIEMITGAVSIPDLQAKVESLFADFEADGSPKHAVILGTVHRTKGLEGETVFVLEPDKIPHPMARQPWEREQERNLAYVAVTRVKYTSENPGRLVFCGATPSIYTGASETKPAVVEATSVQRVNLSVTVTAHEGGWRLSVEPDWVLDFQCASDTDVAMQVAIAVQRALAETRRDYMVSDPGDLVRVK